ncbi:MAG: DNA gyrase inhibitor YacG [Bradyrhizobium sp.]
MPARPPGKASSGRAPAKPCPVCGKPSTAATKPFCSDRCKDVDLHRWLSGSYAIPGRANEDDDRE